MNSKTFNAKNLTALIVIASSVAGCKTVVVEPTVETHVVYSPGENLTALTKVHESLYRCDFPYGGDGGRNLFMSVRDNAGNRNIYRKDNPTSMSIVQLTGGNSKNIAPSYCVATNMVVFDGRPEGNSVSDLYMVDATQGGALKQITNTPNAHERYPCISRDGKRIVYEKMLLDRNEKDTELWMKDLQTNENIQLGLGRTPAFSPDGRSIVFVKYASDGYTTCLCTINADGSNLTQLTDVSMGTVWRPCFSPDGNQVVFQCRKPQKGDDDLYMIDRNGNGLTQLTINKSFDGEPYWANDGNIYFTSDRGGRDKHYQIWRFRYGQPPIPPKPDNGKGKPSPPYRYHTVQSGETITTIARNYGITVKDVVKWNDLSTMTISSGMKLIVGSQR